MLAIQITGLGRIVQRTELPTSFPSGFSLEATHLHIDPAQIGMTMLYVLSNFKSLTLYMVI